MTFWEPSKRGDVSGNDMEKLLLRSLEENAFSAAGLGLRLAHQAERLLEAATEGHGTTPSASTSALSFAEDEYKERADEATARIAAVVSGMGLSYAPVDVAPPSAPTAAAGAIVESAALTPPAPIASSVLSPPSATQPQLPVAAPPRTAAPRSALAMLVAKAKAKHQVDEPTTTTQSMEAVQGQKRPRRPADEQPEPAQRSKPGTRGGGGGEHRHGKNDDDDDDEDGFAVQLPPGVVPAASPATTTAAGVDGGAEAGGQAGDAAVKHPSQMTRDEFLRQFKRAPRRGEVGQSAEEIAKAQKLGYVMSGSRSIGAQMYMDRIQRQLHEREAGKLQQQFRKVEDERMDDQMIEGMLRVIEEKTHKKQE